MRRRFSDKEEAVIRKRIFKGGEDPKEIRKELGISETLMNRITCGATKVKAYAIETSYSGRSKKKK